MKNKITYKELKEYFSALEELHKLINSSQQITAINSCRNESVDYHYTKDGFEEKYERIISYLNTLSDGNYKRLFDHFVVGDSSDVSDLIDLIDLIKEEV